MKVLINGEFQTKVSAADRGLLYGQSVFETVALVEGKARLFDSHLRRLKKGCETLLIPLNINDIERELKVLLDFHAVERKQVLRITVSMSAGGRGYANPEMPSGNRILSLHPYPESYTTDASTGIVLGLSSVRLAQQPLLAGIKHGNRLEQILARSQWLPDWDEAVLRDTDDNVIEGTQSNIILIKQGQVYTPLLDQCGVDGVMKNWVMERLKDAGFSCQAVRLSVQDIIEADEVLLTNSIIGVWPVKLFKSKRYNQSPTAQALLEKLHKDEIIPNF